MNNILNVRTVGTLAILLGGSVSGFAQNIPDSPASNYAMHLIAQSAVGSDVKYAEVSGFYLQRATTAGLTLADIQQAQAIFQVYQGYDAQKKQQVLGDLAVYFDKQRTTVSLADAQNLTQGNTDTPQTPPPVTNAPQTAPQNNDDLAPYTPQAQPGGGGGNDIEGIQLEKGDRINMRNMERKYRKRADKDHRHIVVVTAGSMATVDNFFADANYCVWPSQTSVIGHVTEEDGNYSLVAYDASGKSIARVKFNNARSSEEWSNSQDYKYAEQDYAGMAQDGVDAAQRVFKGESWSDVLIEEGGEALDKFFERLGRKQMYDDRWEQSNPARLIDIRGAMGVQGSLDIPPIVPDEEVSRGANKSTGSIDTPEETEKAASYVDATGDQDRKWQNYVSNKDNAIDPNNKGRV